MSDYFSYDSGNFEDKPELVLAEVEKCLAAMRQFQWHRVIVRCPMQVSRDKDFATNKTFARVTCRLVGIERLELTHGENPVPVFGFSDTN